MNSNSQRLFNSVRYSRMEATSVEQMLSVHAISEYAFCPRAGLLAYENKRDEPDEEVPAFDILPRFEIQAIEREIARLSRILSVLLQWLLVCAIAVPMSFYLRQYWLSVIAAIAMIFISHQAIRFLLQYLELLGRRDEARQSRCQEPDPTAEIMQSVNWFGLLNLGFESIKLEQPLQDFKWRFEGKPWRILRKGALSIPVFRTRSPQEQPKDTQIAKLMAYCRLCSEEFNVECPYGIILTGEDYSGFAVPNIEVFRRAFHDSLVALRQLSQAADNRGEGEVSYEEQKCSHCPLGKPRSISLGQRIYRFGAPVEVYAISGSRHSGNHCDCGDRFQWTPPYRSY